MLIDFSFSNFRSFRDEQAFSMSRSDTKLSPSTVTAVYGANASGKSNFLKSLGAMATMVRTSYSEGSPLSGVVSEPFLLSVSHNGEDAEPSKFLAEFVAADGQKYSYWFAYDAEKILSESLTVYKRLDGRLSTRATKLFERGEDQTDIDFGNAFGPSGLLQQTMNNRPNALVLSAAAAAGIPSIQAAFDFFMPNNFFYGEASQSQLEINNVAQQLAQHTKLSKNLAKLLKYADFGINTVRAVPVSANSIPDIGQFKKQMHESIGVDEEKLSQLFGQNSQLVQLQFEHIGEHGIKRQFVLGQESLGTIGAMSFFSIALRQLSHQSVTLIDEIDTSLHPTLVKELVSLFVDPETNPHGSQLIFTTHDTTLINASGDSDRLLKGDQIWFVEKDQDGASEIYPATDMKLRRKENIGKNYMNGVYGAVPRPAFHSLFAQIINDEDGEEDESESAMSEEKAHE